MSCFRLTLKSHIDNKKDVRPYITGQKKQDSIKKNRIVLCYHEYDHQLQYITFSIFLFLFMSLTEESLIQTRHKFL